MLSKRCHATDGINLQPSYANTRFKCKFQIFEKKKTTKKKNKNKKKKKLRLLTQAVPEVTVRVHHRTYHTGSQMNLRNKVMNKSRMMTKPYLGGIIVPDKRGIQIFSYFSMKTYIVGTH